MRAIVGAQLDEGRSLVYARRNMPTNRNVLGFMALAAIIAPALMFSGCKSDNTETPVDTVTPVDNEAWYAEKLHTRLESLADDRIDVQISLSSWHTLDQLRALLAEPGAPTPTTLHVVVMETFPSETADLAFFLPIEAMSEDAFRSALQSQAAQYAGTPSAPLASLATGDLSHVYVGSFRASGLARETLSWWNGHAAVRFVQVLKTPTDLLQIPLPPGSTY